MKPLTKSSSNLKQNCIKLESLQKASILILVIATLLCFDTVAFSQNVGINTTGSTPNCNAILDLNTGNTSFNTANGNRGLLIPQISLATTASQTDFNTGSCAIPNGLIVFNTNSSITGTGAEGIGYYYWSVPLLRWINLTDNTTSSGGAWLLLGNAGTTDDDALAGNFLGTTDNVALSFRVNNLHAGRIESSSSTANTFFGYQAGNGSYNLASGGNTAMGYQGLYSNTSGSRNTAVGLNALYSNTAVSGNIAIGDSALYTQSYGTSFNSGNVAIGNSALFANQPSSTSYSGTQNTAIGQWAMRYNTVAYGNTAVGYAALYANGEVGFVDNQDAWQNTAVGAFALEMNTSGGNNTAVGYYALNQNGYNDNGGSGNTAIGVSALQDNISGGWNTATGFAALKVNTIGQNNTATGYAALADNTTGNYNTATGFGALNQNTSGEFNTGIGVQALESNTTGNNNTATGLENLFSNTVGQNNTSAGYNALYNNINASQNTAIGVNALFSQGSTYNTGSWYNTDNVAIGYDALYAMNPTTSANGLQNTAVGDYAGYTTSSFNANVTGSDNTYIGYNTGPGTSTQLTNATAIGANAAAAQNNSLVLGGITGVNGGTSVNVGIGTNTPATDAALTLDNGHFASQQATAPTITLGDATAAALTDATDNAGHLSVTPKAAISTGSVTINFNKTYSVAPIVVLTPTNAVAGSQISGLYIVSTTVNGFEIAYSVAPTAVVHTYNYQVIETQ